MFPVEFNTEGSNLFILSISLGDSLGKWYTLIKKRTLNSREEASTKAPWCCQVARVGAIVHPCPGTSRCWITERKGRRRAGSTGHEQKQRGGMCLLRTHLRSPHWPSVIQHRMERTHQSQHRHCSFLQRRWRSCDPLIINGWTFGTPSPCDVYVFPESLASRQNNSKSLASNFKKPLSYHLFFFNI